MNEWMNECSMESARDHEGCSMWPSGGRVWPLQNYAKASAADTSDAGCSTAVMSALLFTSATTLMVAAATAARAASPSSPSVRPCFRRMPRSVAISRSCAWQYTRNLASSCSTAALLRRSCWRRRSARTRTDCMMPVNLNRQRQCFSTSHGDATGRGSDIWSRGHRFGSRPDTAVQ